MKAQHALGLNLSWMRVTTVFLIDIGVLDLAGRWPGDKQVATYVWWSGVGVAALVAIFALVTYRRVPISTMWAAWVRDLFADPETALAEGRTAAVDQHRRYGRESVGMREYQDRLVTLIAVGGRPVVLSGRHHRGESSTVLLPMDLVATGLRQFDVRLECIDIVTVGTHSEPGEQADSAPDQRTTWVLLRMDPQHNVPAVATRDSLAATMVAATERVAQQIDGRNITARVVGAEEFAGIDEAILAGLEPGQIRGRLFKRRRNGRVTSFWVSPRDIGAENLEQLWLPESKATVVTVRLMPGPGRTAEVSVLVRYHSPRRMHKNVRAALNRFVGRRQLEAVCASMPVPARHPGLTPPGRALHGTEHLAISLDPVAEYSTVRVGTQS